MPHRPAATRIAPADEAAIETALARCNAAWLAACRLDEIAADESVQELLAPATDAPIPMADDAAAHLGPAHQMRLMALLREEARRGTALVVTLHDLSPAARYCDRLVLLKDGCIAWSLAPDAALSDAAPAGASPLTPCACQIRRGQCSLS